MSSAALITIGCRYNQVESNEIADGLARAGFELREASEAADVYVVNSCTVTAQADRRCEQILRQLRTQHPEAVLVVTGCLAEAQPDVAAVLPEVDLVLSNREKPTLVARVCEVLGVDPAAGGEPQRERRTSRALLAIQNGCDCRCTYCIVPSARGPGRSEPLDEVMARLGHLAERGWAEVVLTGINLACYGRDLEPSQTLAEVLRRVAELDPLRVRLSSIEPGEVDDALFEAMLLEHVCPHVHLPVQSGSDRVLGAMGRKYRRALVRRLVERLVAAHDRMAIGADILVGFPGETEADFGATLELLTDLPFAYFHVFQYSARPGTRAAELGDTVSPRIKADRANMVRELGQTKWEAFQRRHIGEIVPSIIARKRDARTAKRLAIADNYLRPYLDDGPKLVELVDRVVPVRITELQAGRLFGVIEV